jgi:L-aspartate oxidase
MGTPRLPGDSETTDPQDLERLVIQAGLGVADRKLVSVLVSELPLAAEWLKAAGVVFGGAGPVTLGAPIVSALERDFRSKKSGGAGGGVRLFEHLLIADLCTADGEVCGAAGISSGGEIVSISAPSVILATGGDAQLYRRNVHPDCVTGDGYAMALRAGASLINMEFMQIFLMTVYPTQNLFHAWSKEVLRDIRNRSGRIFLPDYLPEGIGIETCIEENIRHAPFSTRDPSSRYLSIAIVKEILAGRGTEHGGVFLDGREIEFPEVQAAFLRYRGIDPAESLVEISVGHQCSDGGIRIDENAATGIGGLFACGEAAAGMHGADRIGGNMLAASVVFGLRAGRAAARFASAHRRREVPSHAGRRIAEIPRGGRPALSLILSRLKDKSWEDLLVVKSGESLKRYLAELESLRDDLNRAEIGKNPSDIVRALELENLLLCGEATAISALARTENRGGHYREDALPWNANEPPLVSFIRVENSGRLSCSREVLDPGFASDPEDISLKRWG